MSVGCWSPKKGGFPLVGLQIKVTAVSSKFTRTLKREILWLSLSCHVPIRQRTHPRHYTGRGARNLASSFSRCCGWLWFLFFGLGKPVNLWPFLTHTHLANQPKQHQRHQKTAGLDVAQ